MRKHKPLLKVLSVFLSFLMVMTSVVVGNPFAFTADAVSETDAGVKSGLQVFFTSSASGTTRLDRAGLKSSGAFDGNVYLRVKANSALTVTKITSSNANVKVNGAASVSPNASLAANAFGTYTLTASGLAASTTLEFTIDYTVGGKAASAKAYLYAQAPDDTVYHQVAEEFIGGVESSNFYTKVDAKTGYFKVKQFNMADKYSDTANFLSGDNQWEDYGTCQCSTSGYKKGDEHFSSAYYYIDTSVASTWENAGFMYTAKDSNTERTGDTSKRQRLKTFRIGLSKDFVNASGTVGAEFRTNFDDANPTTPLADISKSVYKVGAYEASNSSWTKLSSGEELFSSGRMDDMPVLGNCRGDNTFSISLNGTIPTGVSNAPFHAMYRISSDSYNFVTGSEETTLSFTYYLTSYNKGELRNALAKYEGTGLVSSSFDAAKWSDYLAAYKNAKKILGDEITTQLSIDAAKAKLDRAYAKLFDSDTAGGALPPTEINSGLSLEPVVNNSGANKDKPVTRVLRNSSDNDIGYVYYGTADAYATQSFFYIKATNHSLEPVTVTKLTLGEPNANKRRFQSHFRRAVRR